jgi:DNA-binding NarL/FixJ family response regulator
MDRRFKIIGSCSDSNETIHKCQQLKPDILLLDISMTPLNGIDSTKRIRRVSPGTGIIAVTMSNHPAHAKKMFLNGALGYVTKNSSVSEMKEAILTVSEGKKFICEEIKDILFASEESSDVTAAIQSLTGRELEVIKQIKAGRSSKEISEALDIALKTVETHRHNILKKLNVRNAVSLVQLLEESAVKM